MNKYSLSTKSTVDPDSTSLGLNNAHRRANMRNRPGMSHYNIRGLKPYLPEEAFESSYNTMSLTLDSDLVLNIIHDHQNFESFPSYNTGFLLITRACPGLSAWWSQLKISISALEDFLMNSRLQDRHSRASVPVLSRLFASLLCRGTYV